MHDAGDATMVPVSRPQMKHVPACSPCGCLLLVLGRWLLEHLYPSGTQATCCGLTKQKHCVHNHDINMRLQGNTGFLSLTTPQVDASKLCARVF